jgi:hypothetical protein
MQARLALRGMPQPRYACVVGVDVPRPIGLSARLVIVLATLGGIVGLHRLSAARGTGSGVQTQAFTLATRPPALRPGRALELDVGTSQARAALVSGFGPDTWRERRTEALAGNPARLAFALAPDGAMHRLTLVGRSADGSFRNARVKVNEAPVGSVTMVPAFGRGQIDVAGELLVSGLNEITLESDGEIALDWVELVPSSGSFVGDPRTRALREPPCRSEFVAAPAREARCTPSSGPVGDLFVDVHPYGRSYAVGLHGNPGIPDGASALQLLVNGVASGEIRLGAGVNGGLVHIPTARLKVGVNVLQPSLMAGPPATLESLVLRPLTAFEFLDVGANHVRPQLASGFSTDEGCESGNCAWSSATSSRVLLALEPRAGRYRLTVVAQAFVAIAPLDVTIAVNGKMAGRVTWGAALEPREIEIAAGVLVSGINQVAFSYARTAQPSAMLPGSKDARHLALRFDWIELFPTDG